MWSENEGILVPYLCRIHTRLPQVVGMDHQAVPCRTMPTITRLVNVVGYGIVPYNIPYHYYNICYGTPWYHKDPRPAEKEIAPGLLLFRTHLPPHITLEKQTMKSTSRTSLSAFNQQLFGSVPLTMYLFKLDRQLTSFVVLLVLRTVRATPNINSAW